MKTNSQKYGDKLEIYSRIETERFLNLLDPTTNEFTFQTFDDDQDRGAKHLARVLHGTLAQHWELLCQLSQEGAGIFITVNNTDGKGRKLENIIDIRAVWREDDEGTQVTLPLAPQIKVESSPGKYHDYILVHGLSIQQHQQVQTILADTYGSDKNAKDAPRVLRLPGFSHQKNNSKKGLDGTPTLVTVVECSDNPTPYTADQVLAAFGVSADGSVASDLVFSSFESSANDELLNNILAEDQVKDLRLALQFLDADCRDEWIRVGQNLKLYGEVGFEVWDTWAQQSVKYEADDSFKTWRGLQGDRSNHKSIFTRAMACGWINPKKTTETTTLANVIYQKLAHQLGGSVTELEQHELLGLYAIDKMIKSTLWQPTRNKFSLIGKENNLLISSEKDIAMFLRRNYGLPYNIELVNKSIDDYIENERHNKSGFTTMAAQEKFRSQIHTIPLVEIINHIKLNNQRPKLELRTDMFSNDTYIDLTRADKAIYRFKYTPSIYTLTGCPEGEMSEIYEDYKAHFPMLDEIIESLVAARFAPDRKKAYVWLHCPSDWGKGFLLSILDELGLVVNMSEKELDSLLSGSPVGKSAPDFVNSLALVFDEAKRVTGNHKLLQSSIPCTPKHEMTVYVPVYLKLFLSAEHIYSLAGEHGVETQFANRFNLLRLEGNLSQRALFRSVGNGLYYKVCKHYISRVIDEKINHYRSMGQMAAEKESQDYLNTFHEKYGIGNSYDLLDSRLGEIAGEILTLAFQISDEQNFAYGFQYPASLISTLKENVVKNDDGRLFIKSPTTVVRAYIESTIEQASQKMMMFKSEAIINLMGVLKKHRVKVAGNQSVIRGIDITESVQSLDCLLA